MRYPCEHKQCSVLLKIRHCSRHKFGRQRWPSRLSNQFRIVCVIECFNSTWPTIHTTNITLHTNHKTLNTTLYTTLHTKLHTILHTTLNAILHTTLSTTMHTTLDTALHTTLHKTLHNTLDNALDTKHTATCPLQERCLGEGEGPCLPGQDLCCEGKCQVRC